MTVMDVIDWLTAALGEDADDVLSVDPDHLDAARGDHSGWVADGLPLAIVNARTVDRRLPRAERGAHGSHPGDLR